MTTAFTRTAAGVFALMAIAVSTPAWAQFTIDQDSALAGAPAVGMFNDPPGFPVMIMKPGYYKLTSDLVVPAETSGITVHTPGVTLDLNGFTISSGGRCASDPNRVMTCSGLFGWHGVEFLSTGNTLRNGRVMGFGIGVMFKGADLIENLLVEHSYFTGLQSPQSVGAPSLIRAVRAQLSRQDGFNVSNVEIKDSSASANGRDGFRCVNSMLLDSTAFRNYSSGVSGGVCGIGRTMAMGNKGGDLTGTWYSMGHNLTGAGAQP